MLERWVPTYVMLKLMELALELRPKSQGNQDTVTSMAR